VKFRWQNALILMILCALVGGAVALTYSVAEPRIRQLSIDKANAARLALFPEADSFEAVALSGDSPLDNCYAVRKNGRLLGYSAQITVSGCQGMIEIIAGTDNAQRLVGIRVGGASFAETPNLGAKVQEAAFTDQFVGLPLPAELNGGIDGVTGATISSAAVVRGVNLIGEALAALTEKEG